ncbi:MAG: DNA topoisomerase VI, partial [Thermoprotei archaeon]
MSVDEMRVLEALEALGRRLRDQILKGEPPALEIPARTLANVVWDPKSKMLRLGPRKLRREFLDMGEAKKFMQTVLMLSLIVRARREGDYPTIRDLYYAGKHTIEYVDEHGRRRREETWDSQRESDSVIQDIEVATGLLREHMGILHDTKGKIVGRLIVRSAGDVIDCSRMGDGAYSIPPNPDSLEILEVDAEYVLVIE